MFLHIFTDYPIDMNQKHNTTTLTPFFHFLRARGIEVDEQVIVHIFLLDDILQWERDQGDDLFYIQNVERIIHFGRRTNEYCIIKATSLEDIHKISTPSLLKSVEKNCVVIGAGTFPGLVL